MTTHTMLRVRFAETDQMGIAHHSAYVAWFEVGRVEWLRDQGLSYRVMEEEGVSLAVSALEIDYRAAVRFDDEIRVETELLEGRSRRFAFAYRIFVPASGVVAARGKTIHTPVDADGRAIRLPPKWLDVLAQTRGNADTGPHDTTT